MSSSTDVASLDAGSDDAPHRVQASARLHPVAVGLLLAAAALVGLAVVVTGVVLGISLEDTDLWVFREAGRLVREGSPLYDYRFEPGYWTYPPFGALVMVPLTVVPVGGLMPLAWLTDAVALLALVRLSFDTVLRRLPGRPARWGAVVGLSLLAALLYPVSFTFAQGQLGILVVLACTADVVLLGRRGSRLQGVLVGLTAAIKLTPLLFLPVYAVGRRWRSAVLAGATVAVCWLVAAVVLPGDTRTWIERRILFRTNDQISGHGNTYTNQSLRGLVDGLPDPLVVPVWLLLAVPVVVCLVVAGRALRSGLLLEAAAITGLATLLVSPISWTHHGVWVVPALGALAARARTRHAVEALAAVAVVLALAVTLPMVDLYTLCYLGLFGMLCLQVRQHSSVGAEVVVDGLDSSPERYQREAYHDVMYTGAVGTFSGLVHRIMERPFRSKDSGDVLELGAGAGQHAEYVATFTTYLETDIAPRPERGPEPREGVERALVDAQDLSRFPDASFDRVIATCLLAHLDQPEKALQEWRRVTRPGGTVTIYVPSEPGMLLRLARATIMVPKARRFAQDHVATVYREHRNHYPAMRMLVDSTFRDDDVRRSRWPVPFVGWNFSLFDVVHATRRD